MQGKPVPVPGKQELSDKPDEQIPCKNACRRIKNNRDPAENCHTVQKSGFPGTARKKIQPEEKIQKTQTL